MEKIIKWIQENRKRAVAIIVAVIFVPILLIQGLFLIPAPFCLLDAEWEAGDALGYFGDVLSFLGTVILGYVAILQTEKANTISEKLMELDLVKTKPCFDFHNSQKYFMTLIGDKYAIEKKYKSEELMVLDLLITANPRTGITTNVGFIEFKVTNSGHSDIRFIYVNKVKFYLLVKDPRNRNETIPMLTGNTNIKVGETKKMLVCVEREFVSDEDAADTFYKDNVEKMMPHLELDLHLVTTEGIDYYEKIICASNWHSEMKSQKHCIERELVVLKLDVSTENN